MVEHQPHNRKALIKVGTLTFYHTYFFESDIVDGDFPRDDTVSDVYTGLTAEDAAGMIQCEGLTFDSTLTIWAADPDGYRTPNYATGRSVEISAHLEGFSKAEEMYIWETVG